MRAATLLGSVIAAERRMITAPRRRLEVTPQDLIDSVEISADEILDDLLYPADRGAMVGGAQFERNGEGR